MSTNHEKLFKLIAELTELDDPRIKINVNVGMQLIEWVNKNESPASLRNNLNRVPGARLDFHK